jgi:hypothetical protein
VSGYAREHNGEILAPDEMNDIYLLPDENDSTYQKRCDDLEWYVDQYLPMAAGAKNYKKDFRQKYLMTAPITKSNKKRYTAVSIQSEAFGLMVYKNCHRKWKFICEMKSRNPKWTLPKYKKTDTDNLKYHKTLWSDRDAGKGKGWKAEAIKYHNVAAQMIKLFRRTDREENDNKMMKFCRDLMRKKYGYNLEQNVRKRKARNGSAMVVDLEKEIISISDDPHEFAGSDDDDYLNDDM